MPPTAAAGPHVAVLAFPFGTHAVPLLAVVDRLAALSPATHFSFFSTAQSNASAFKNRSSAGPSNVRAQNVWDGIPEGHQFTGRHQEAIELFMAAAPAGFRKGIEAAEAEFGRKVSCLVTDAFYWFAAEMAEELRVPWVGFWTAGPNALSSHLSTDRLREALGNVPDAEAQLGSLVPGMSKIRVKDLPEGVVTGDLASIFSTMLHKMSTHLPKSATTVFINSFHDLDPTITNDLASRFNNFLNIGPFHLLSPARLPTASVVDTDQSIPWLNDRNLAPSSVAYISSGSVVIPPPHEIRAVAEALEATQVPFIWSLKDHARVHLPQGFVERSKGEGIMLQWAPQLEILRHSAVGVFVTHGGWNSVLESIAGGVPMICRPFFADQRLNGRMLEDVWEIGVNLEGGVFSKDGLVSCLDRVLRKEQGTRMRGNARVLKEKAETATKPKGGSTNDFFKLVEIVSTTTP